MTLSADINHEHILSWLKEDDPRALQELWAEADNVRRENVGDAVHLRGLVEISNYCVRNCAYCGLNRGNKNVSRYRMSKPEIMDSVHKAEEFGYGTVVLQSGEDTGLDCDWVTGLLKTIKSETKLAVTLSLGERSHDELKIWRDAGADRYLLRFETSNTDLFNIIHPALSGEPSDRLKILYDLKELGYETGSGVMIGIPGQSFDDLADDIILFRQLDLDMIGVGPYIPHPLTSLAKDGQELMLEDGRQVPNTELMTYKVLALTRIVRPLTNIPSTTALATLNQEQGRELGLERGANVIMPNLTPPKYRTLYEIYPAKACLYESETDFNACVKSKITAIGRTVGTGRGDSLNKKQNVPL